MTENLSNNLEVEDYIDTLELNGKEFSRENNGRVKMLEGHEYIGNRIYLEKEELDAVISFLTKVSNLNRRNIK